MKFADLCEEFIIQAQSGEPYDVENLPEETIPFLYDISHFACGRICDRADRNRSNEKPDEDCTYEAGCSRLYEKTEVFILTEAGIYFCIIRSHVRRSEGREFRWRWKQYPYKFFG